MTPQERRDFLTIRFYLKLKASLSNPTNKCITGCNVNLFRNHHENPFSIRGINTSSSYNLPHFIVKSDFSCLIHNCTTPKYAIPNPTCNTELSKLPKLTTSPFIYRANFLELLNRRYRNFTAFYTDGSKSSDGVGSAAISDLLPCIASLPVEASIFTAELHAIQMVVDSIDRLGAQSRQQKNYVIFTDSKSSLEALHNQNNHPVIRYIMHKLGLLKQRGYCIELCWVPSHVNIEGNEKADRSAKEASKRRAETIPIFYKDYFSVLRSKFEDKRKHVWQTNPRPSKLREVNPNLTPWPALSNIRRNEEVVLNRVRLGHTNLTHKHLMESSPPPVCNDAALSISHIFT